jgi:hypothetical protein
MGSERVWRRMQRRFGHTIQFWWGTKLGCRNGVQLGRSAAVAQFCRMWFLGYEANSPIV